jgi:hypothetical protein
MAIPPRTEEPVDTLPWLRSGAAGSLTDKRWSPHK